MLPVYLVTNHFPPLAYSRKWSWYARALAAAGLDVTVVTAVRPGRGPGHDHFEDPQTVPEASRVSVRRLAVPGWGGAGTALAWLGLAPCPHANWHWRLRRDLTPLLRRRPGVVLAVHPPAANLSGAAAAAGAAGCPLAVDLRESYGARSSWLWRLLPGRRERGLGRLLPRAALVSVCTEALRDELLARHRLDARRTVVTHDGFAGPLPEVRPVRAGRPLTCLCISRLSGREESEVFAHAWHRLAAAAPAAAAGLRLLFYGPPSRRVRRRLAPLLVDGHVEFGGFLPADSLPAALREADLGLVSFAPGVDRHAVPGRLYDFLAHGRPVLGVLPEGAGSTILQNSRAGWRLAAGDAAGAARRLGELAADRESLVRAAGEALAARERLRLDPEVTALGHHLRRRAEAGTLAAS